MRQSNPPGQRDDGSEGEGNRSARRLAWQSRHLDAYQEAKKRVDALAKDLLDAEKARKRLEKQAAVTTADAQAAQDPVQRLHDLRGTISRELTGLAERFEQEIETYRKIKAAIETKREELDTLYEVETAASDLAALIDAQRAKKALFEDEMAAQKAAYDSEMQEMRAAWQREKAEHDRQIKEQAEALETRRQREKEAYDYASAREKEQRQNALEDELQALAKEIALKRGEFEATHQQRKAELDAREEALAIREKEMAALQKEVESFPKRSEAAVQAAVAEASERITRASENAQALMQARFEGEKNVLLGKIEALEKLVASQTAQISDLTKRNDQAYEKVQDIANRAVAASRREGYPAPAYHTAPAARNDSQG